MGQAVTQIRDELKSANEDTRLKMEERLHVLEKMRVQDKQQASIIAGQRGDHKIHNGTVVQASADEDTRRKMEERLQILEKMVQGNLDKQQASIIDGQRGDHKIHTGTVVQAFKQVNVVMREKASTDLENAIDDFFQGSFMSGFSKLVSMSVKAVLGNSSMGEYQSSSMLIVWTDNALLRCDTYCYRWNFSSAGVIEQVEGAVGVLMIQRVIDVSKTDPQVLSWAITRQARLCAGPNNEFEMIGRAMMVLEKVAKFQQRMKAIKRGKIEDKNCNGKSNVLTERGMQINSLLSKEHTKLKDMKSKLNEKQTRLEERDIELKETKSRLEERETELMKKNIELNSTGRIVVFDCGI